jgi:hypothetical protein
LAQLKQRQSSHLLYFFFSEQTPAISAQQGIFDEARGNECKIQSIGTISLLVESAHAQNKCHEAIQLTTADYSDKTTQ